MTSRWRRLRRWCHERRRRRRRRKKKKRKSPTPTPQNSTGASSMTFQWVFFLFLPFFFLVELMASIWNDCVISDGPFLKRWLVLGPPTATARPRNEFIHRDRKEKIQIKNTQKKQTKDGRFGFFFQISIDFDRVPVDSTKVFSFIWLREFYDRFILFFFFWLEIWFLVFVEQLFWTCFIGFGNGRRTHTHTHTHTLEKKMKEENRNNEWKCK